jgi:site-specific recombinase XerD
MQTHSPEAPNWRAEFRRLEGAYAPATIRSYLGDIAAFETWCQEEGIVPFPAEVETVCRFIEDQGIEKAPSTVRRRLYAIRKVHRLMQMPDPTHDEEINLSLRRVRRSKAIRPRQAKGLTRDYLDRFRATQPDTVIGLRNRAMLSVCGFR